MTLVVDTDPTPVVGKGEEKRERDARLHGGRGVCPGCLGVCESVACLNETSDVILAREAGNSFRPHREDPGQNVP